MRAFGDGLTATITHFSTIVDSQGNVPPVCLVDGAVAAGLKTVTLDAALGLSGRLARGSTLSFGGHATVYTVAADVIARTNELTGVTLTTKLTSSLADDEAVTFVSLIETFTAPAALLRIAEQDSAGDTVDSGQQKVVIYSPAKPITDDDVLELAPRGAANGAKVAILRVLEQAPAGEPVSYQLIVGPPGD